MKESEGKTSIKFYLFVDDFYYKTNWDLYSMNFKILAKMKWRVNSQRVKFVEGLPHEKRPLEEKISE